jgi:hypothetical protein
MSLKTIILRIFNIEDKETTRFTVPPYAVKKGLDYKWILWKFKTRNKRDHFSNSHWDTETRIDGQRIDTATDESQNMN